MQNTTTQVIIYTDGACSGNPGPGGWAAILGTPDGTVRELGDAAKRTTNNRMEISAALEALKKTLALGMQSHPVLVCTDSRYVINGITAWIFNWQRNGWLNSQGQPVENKDLWEELAHTVQQFPRGQIKWRYVAGHAGIAGNERCDTIAVAFSKEETIYLYEGPAKDYVFDISIIPDESLSSSAGKTDKSKTYYLSAVNGQVFRDKEWKQCEARVKGVRGAKFKKCTSPEEEKTLLRQWGIVERS
jgi:ribonuclease HI